MPRGTALEATVEIQILSGCCAHAGDQHIACADEAELGCLGVQEGLFRHSVCLHAAAVASLCAGMHRLVT